MMVYVEYLKWSDFYLEKILTLRWKIEELYKDLKSYVAIRAFKYYLNLITNKKKVQFQII